jgi:hypothetical protein
VMLVRSTRAAEPFQGPKPPTYEQLVDRAQMETQINLARQMFAWFAVTVFGVLVAFTFLELVVGRG